VGSACFFFVVANGSRDIYEAITALKRNFRHTTVGPVVEEKLCLLRAKLQGQSSFYQS